MSLQNQIGLLKSNTLVESVVEKLKLTDNYSMKEGGIYLPIYPARPFEVTSTATKYLPSGFQITLSDFTTTGAKAKIADAKGIFPDEINLIWDKEVRADSRNNFV